MSDEKSNEYHVTTLFLNNIDPNEILINYMNF